MRNQLSTPLIAALTLLALAGCAAGGTKVDPADGGKAATADLPLTGSQWSVTSLTVDGKKSAAPDAAHVEITEKGRLQGNSGCNRFSAKAEIDGDTLTLGAGERTQIGCAAPAQEFEESLSAVLTGRLKAALAGKKLTLTTEKGDSVALAAAEPAPLTGTVWTVDSLLTGDVASTLPPGAEGRAQLTLDKDGTMHGRLGCNTFTADAKVSGSEITVDRLAATRRMCSGSAQKVEAHMLAVLDGKITYDLVHRGLTLNGPGDKRVSATAGR